jgi:hypothetical protein
VPVEGEGELLDAEGGERIEGKGNGIEEEGNAGAGEIERDDPLEMGPRFMPEPNPSPDTISDSSTTDSLAHPVGPNVDSGGDSASGADSPPSTVP